MKEGEAWDRGYKEDTSPHVILCQVDLVQEIRGLCTCLLIPPQVTNIAVDM